MRLNLFVLCFLLEIINTSSSGLQTFELELYYPCTLSKTNESGSCSRYDECGTLWGMRIREFDICSFEGRAPIVCCPIKIQKRFEAQLPVQLPVALPVELPVQLQTLVHHTPVLPTQSKAFLSANATRRISFQECAKIIENYYPELAYAVTEGTAVLNLHNCPYMSRIGHNNGNATEFYCGGTLISEDFVITAAHCRYSSGGGATNAVRLGYDEDFEVKQFINHPQYDRFTKHNDIALIQMNEKFTFRDYKSKPIIPACLHQYDSNEISVKVFGYGLTSFYGEASDILMMAQLKTIKNENCSKTYEDDAEIIESQVCAFDPEGLGKDSCQGDSGGPLTITFSNSSFDIASKYGWTKIVKRMSYRVVVGITSFGQVCGSKIPGVYTRVYSYLDWIEGIVWADRQINHDHRYIWQEPYDWSKWFKL